MRKPSEYIASAYRNLRANLLPDMTAIMTHGEYCAAVTRVGTRSVGEDEVTGDIPTESVRVLALACDFPVIARDEVVLLNDDFHIVTSSRIDPAAASLTVGLTTALRKHTSIWTGVRRSARSIRATVDILATNNGKQTEYADGYAPVEVYSWSVVVPKSAWHEIDPPQTGDAIENDFARIKVSNVSDKGGYWVIAARSR